MFDSLFNEQKWGVQITLSVCFVIQNTQKQFKRFLNLRLGWLKIPKIPGIFKILMYSTNFRAMLCFGSIKIRNPKNLMSEGSSLTRFEPQWPLPLCLLTQPNPKIFLHKVFYYLFIILLAHGLTTDLKIGPLNVQFAIVALHFGVWMLKLLKQLTN